MFLFLVADNFSLAAKPPSTRATDKQSASAPFQAPQAKQAPRLWSEQGTGRTAQATLLGASQTHARFRKAPGKTVTIALASLSAADRAYIAGAMAIPEKTAPAAAPASRVILRAVADAPPAKAKKPPAPADARWQNLWKSLELPGNPRAQMLRWWLREQARASGPPRPVPANMVYVRFSESFLRQYIRQSVDRSQRVTDNILGTAIYGTARLTGRTHLELVPSEDRASAEIRLTGTTYSNTVGYNGPVQIYSSATTPYTSVKTVSLGGEKPRATAARTVARTRSMTTGISTHLPGLRGCIVRRVAWRRVAASRGQADYIAARHAEARISRAFDATIEQRMAGLTQGIAVQLAKFAIEREIPIAGLRYSTTDDYLQAILLSTRDAGRPEAAAPPRQAKNPDVEVHVHSALLSQALSESQWRGVLQPVMQLLLAQRILQGASQTPEGLASNWRVQYSGGGEWITLVWDTEPAAEPTAIVRNSSGAGARR